MDTINFLNETFRILEKEDIIQKGDRGANIFEGEVRYIFPPDDPFNNSFFVGNPVKIFLKKKFGKSGWKKAGHRKSYNAVLRKIT